VPRPRLVVLVVGLFAVLAFVFAIEPASHVSEPPPRAAATPRARTPVRVAVVGDSLSAGRSMFLGNGLDDESWMTYAQGDGLVFAGGWARAGATPADMAAAITPIDDVDVVVVLAGTNAVRRGLTVAEQTAAYDRIVATVDADRVVVCAIPPYPRDGSAQRTYNRELRTLVLQRGWEWADPWTTARTGQEWAQGFSADGVHPAGPAQYAVLGKAIREIVLGTRTVQAAQG
jgi:hypothetical protein